MDSIKHSSNIDQYLKRIRSSESRVKQIISSQKSNKSILNFSRKKSEKNSEKSNEMGFIKEYIKKKIKKYLKKLDISSWKSENYDLDKSNEITILNTSINDNSIPNDKYRARSGEPDAKQNNAYCDENIKNEINLKKTKSSKLKNLKEHIKPKNPSEFMKNYYKYHVKIHFSPQKPAKTSPISLMSDNRGSKKNLMISKFPNV